MKLKIALLYLLGLLVSISPIMIFFIANASRYVSSGYDAFKLASGGVIIAFILLLKVMGKLKIPSAVSVFGIMLLLSYLLDAVLRDLMLFSFLALIGELGDLVVQIFIARLKEKQAEQKMEGITVRAIEKTVISGRV